MTYRKNRKKNKGTGKEGSNANNPCYTYRNAPLSYANPITFHSSMIRISNSSNAIVKLYSFRKTGMDSDLQLGKLPAQGNPYKRQMIERIGIMARITICNNSRSRLQTADLECIDAPTTWFKDATNDRDIYMITDAFGGLQHLSVRQWGREF